MLALGEVAQPYGGLEAYQKTGSENVRHFFEDDIWYSVQAWCFEWMELVNALNNLVQAWHDKR